MSERYMKKRKEKFWFYQNHPNKGEPIEIGDLVSKKIIPDGNVVECYGIVIGIHRLNVPLYHWNDGTQRPSLASRLTLIERA